MKNDQDQSHMDSQSSVDEQATAGENQFYRVEVSDRDGQIVVIEPRMLAGRDIGPLEDVTIRTAIRQLCGFIGLSPGEAHGARAIPTSSDAKETQGDD